MFTMIYSVSKYYKMPVIVLALAAISCERAPDLASLKWSEIEVSYTLPGDDDLKSRVWSSMDPATLDRLRKAFREQKRVGLSTAFVAKSHHVIITIDNGDEWRLSFKTADHASLHKLPERHPSAGVYLKSQFLEALEEAVSADLGNDIDLLAVGRRMQNQRTPEHEDE